VANRKWRLIGLEEERARLMEKSAKKLAKRTNHHSCGTITGYIRHLNKKPKERPCKVCRAAWYERNKRNDARRQQRD